MFLYSWTLLWGKSPVHVYGDKNLKCLQKGRNLNTWSLAIGFVGILNIKAESVPSMQEK